MNTSISDLRRTQRQGFTAFELLIVLGIIFVLAAMTMPAIFSALRKGRVSDAANAITYVSTQARQLARARQPLAVGVTAKAYGVAVVAPTATSPGYYVALTYGGPLPSDAVELMSNGKPVSKFLFNRNVMVFQGADFQSATALSSGNRIVWYFQNQTGLPLQNANDLVPIGIGTEAQAGQFANMGTFAPAVLVSPVCGSLSVRSLDYNATSGVGYAAAIAIYQIGLPNVRNQ